MEERNYAVEKDVQIMLGREECAVAMEQSANDTARRKDVL